MHAFFLPFGIYPNNAIVGGSAPIATGAALYQKNNDKKGVVVCNIGDASLGCGPVYEAMNFSAMDQFKTLWEEGRKGGLPIIFNVFDNFYGIDHGRDHGLQHARPSRRRHHPEPDARRACRRLEPAGCHRRLQA